MYAIRSYYAPRVEDVFGEFQYPLREFVPLPEIVEEPPVDFLLLEGTLDVPDSL